MEERSISQPNEGTIERNMSSRLNYPMALESSMRKEAIMIIISCKRSCNRRSEDSIL